MGLPGNAFCVLFVIKNAFMSKSWHLVFYLFIFTVFELRFVCVQMMTSSLVDFSFRTSPMHMTEEVTSAAFYWPIH